MTVEKNSFSALYLIQLRQKMKMYRGSAHLNDKLIENNCPYKHNVD